MRRIVFDIARGNIKVTGADTQEVAVSGNKVDPQFGREDADRTNNNTPIEVVPEGDHLLVRANQDRASNNQRVSDDIEVTVLARWRWKPAAGAAISRSAISTAMSCWEAPTETCACPAWAATPAWK